MAIRPSSFTMTDFAICLPETWADSAISRAVYAFEWMMMTYRAFCASRNSRSFGTGMAPPSTRVSLDCSEPGVAG